MSLHTSHGTSLRTGVRRFLGALLAAGLVVCGMQSVFAWPDGAAVEKIERKPVRDGVFLPDPENGIYFLQRNGEELLFNSREYQPGSSWKRTPTALYVVDAATGKLKRKIPTDSTIDFQIQPQGKLAAAHEAGGFRLYDLESGKVIAQLNGESAPHEDIEWSPDGKLFTFHGKPSELYVYDVAAGASRLIRKNRFAQLHSPAWSPDSKSLAILEDRTNILSQTVREIKVLDADPASSLFGEITHELEVEKKAIKNLLRVSWADAGTLVGWNRLQGGDAYQEVVVDVASGKTLGTGRAEDHSVDDTDGLWTYAHAETGATGDFETLFGKKHPRKKHPLPLPLDSKGAIRSAQYQDIDGELVLWDRSYAKWQYRVVADRAGRPLFSIPRDGITHVSRLGNALRIYQFDGRFVEYDVQR